MTWFLTESGVSLTTLDVRLDGGSAWVCLMNDDGGSTTCGPSQSPRRATDRTWSVLV